MSKIKSMNILAGLVFSLTLGACDSSKTTSKKDPLNPRENSSVQTDPSVAKILGLWKTECTGAEDNGFSQSVMSVNANNTVEHKTNIYLEQQCETAAYTITQTFTVKDDGTATEGVFDLASTATGVSIRIESAEVVGNFNQNQVCGEDHWTVGENVDVAGKTCGQSQMAAQGTVSRITVYPSIDKIEVNVAGAGYTVYFKKN